MKPHIICHMTASVDGKTILHRWQPGDVIAAGLFEQVHRDLHGDAWLVGRVTGEEFAAGTAYPVSAQESFPRTTWIAQLAGSYAVILDPRGTLAWGRADIDGDAIIVALTRQVADSHLAGLRADGVSYCFAGDSTLDLAQLADILHGEFGIRRLLLEGGAHANASFLEAGLVDELSLIVAPAIDATPSSPGLFESRAAHPSRTVQSMSLQSCRTLDAGAVWLRYSIVNQPAGPHAAT